MHDIVIGVDFGGTTIKFGIIDKRGEICKKWSINTNIRQSVNLTLKQIARTIIDHSSNKYHFIGIGIGIPGSVRPKSYAIYDCNNLGWNEDIDIITPLKQYLHVPIIVENDANAASIGERWKGAGDKENLLFVTLGTGVGGAVILNNHLVHGSTGAAGEIGHVVVNPNGYMCTCGNRGCLETVSSATGIVNLYRNAVKKQNLVITAKEIFEQAKQNSPLANKVINEACDYLGLAVANVVNVLNLQEVIIGGGISNAGEFLRLKVEKAMNKYLYSSNRGVTHVKLATLGNEAGILGAAKLIWNYIS